jgi:hypothetical protein
VIAQREYRVVGQKERVNQQDYFLPEGFYTGGLIVGHNKLAFLGKQMPC